MKLFRQLCVGCGNKPVGTVNCDVSIIDIAKHRGLHSKPINTKITPNFILCDALNLPFKDNSFDTIFSAQVIEHTEKPFSFLKELVRVARNKITIETMHRYGERFESYTNREFAKWYKEHHVSKFDFTWFSIATRKLNCFLQNAYVINYYYFPHKYFPLFKYPHDIGVVIKKGGS